MFTEVYLPFGYRSPWFVAPHAGFLDPHTAARRRKRRTSWRNIACAPLDFGVDLGRELGNYGEVRAGWGRSFGESRVRVGDPTLRRAEFDSRTFFAEFRYDSVDNVNFPRHGGTFQLGWQAEREGKGDLADADADLRDLRPALCAFLGTQHRRVLGERRHPHATTTSISCGRSSRWADSSTCQALRPKHWSVLTTPSCVASITGRSAGAAPGSSTCRYTSAPRSSRATCGATGVTFPSNTAKTNGSVFVGLDTILGPVYFATGFDDGGDSAYYLFLGRTF